MNIILKNERALVTGATRGIGKAIAQSLAAAGAYVVGTATSAQGAESIKSYLGEQGEGQVYRSDDLDSLDALMASMKAAAGMPTILVNNAGITKDNLLMRMKQAEWDAVLQTNLTAVYQVTKTCLRPMMKAKGGRIINITSVVGLSGNAGQSNYVATKAGLIGLTKSLAQEIGSRGITVNAVAPGFIDTDMTKKLPDEQKQALLAQIPLGKLGQAEDIAQAVTFLASSSAGYITGETLSVNGGMYMN